MAPFASTQGELLPSMQAGVLALRLRSHERNRHSLWDWLHPSRHDSAANMLRGAATSAMRRRNAHIWLDAKGYRCPPVEAFMDAGQAFYELCIPRMLSAARLRAMYSRRAELRHWIGVDHRRRLAQWLGPRATEWVRALLARNGSAAGLIPTGTPARPLETLSGDELAWEGYCLLQADGVLSAQGPMSLLPLALDPGVSSTESGASQPDPVGAAVVGALCARGDRGPS